MGMELARDVARDNEVFMAGDRALRPDGLGAVIKSFVQVAKGMTAQPSMSTSTLDEWARCAQVEEEMALGFGYFKGVLRMRELIMKLFGAGPLDDSDMILLTGTWHEHRWIPHPRYRRAPLFYF
jgi:hypothetical protein